MWDRRVWILIKIGELRNFLEHSGRDMILFLGRETGGSTILNLTVLLASNSVILREFSNR